MLNTFKAISNFVNELGSEFENNQNKSLKLYKHLLSKTKFSHENVVKKHIKVWTNFCIDNREGIENKKIELFENHIVEYTEKVKIDMKSIFKQADTKSAELIWKHLLTIAALTDKNGKAKEILLNENKETKEDNETAFLSNIIKNVEEQVDENENPIQSVSKILSSGVFTDLIEDMGKGVENGTLNMERMMSSVQTMMNSLNTSSNSNENSISQIPDLTNMLQNMIAPSSMNNGISNLKENS